jgi:Zn finger protein HypA/HybF involved in hydrogenase expression
MASFPLIGLHAVAPCEECHINAEFKTAANNCNACHQSEDIHEQRLGLSCDSCHNPNGWSLWEFDHDSLTKFPLDGAHEGIDCLSCHDTEATHGIKLSPWCADCHRKDDVHDGQFGRNCERCHNDESFDAIQIR